MKSLVTGGISTALSLCMGLTYAYEIDTHAELSTRATEVSNLIKNPEILKSLGLKPIEADEMFPNSRNGSGTIRELIRDGARFEDGFNYLSTRSLNHFFDPLYNRPLTVTGSARGERSPDWALEDPASLSNQEYSWRDARASLYKGLTLTTLQERDRYFGLTFQTLGHVIHHLQDMAQPQHVRNDTHCDRWYCGAIGQLNPSLYEKWTDDHRAGLPYGGATVRFPRLRDFWSNDAGSGIAQYTNRNFVSAGTNFAVQLDNNGQLVAAPNAEYPLPVPLGSADPIPIQTLLSQEPDYPCLGADAATLPQCRLAGDVLFYRSAVQSRAATLSIFDQDIERYNTPVRYSNTVTGSIYVTERLFTLNRFNFNDAYPLLIPRAVGYSAGLIDYFFRGQIELNQEYDITTAGQYLIQNKGAEPMKGDFTLYYDAVDGKRYPVPGDTDTATWRNVVIAPNQSSPVLIAPKGPTDPKPKTLDDYFLVFKGEMGQERPLDAQSIGAVVAKSKNHLLWEPWREQLTDNHPWAAYSGTVDGVSGPNSQTVQNGSLVESAGVKGAGGVVWEAATPDDALPLAFMKIRLSCSPSALGVDWEVYGYLSVGTELGQSDAQTISFAGGAGPGNQYDFPRFAGTKEFIVDLRGIPFKGQKIANLEIATIGFTTELTCSVDYLDFSEEPFEKVAADAVFIPW